jgi:Reverse transcriptase (RNA-dependent DNA polymerase)
MPERVKPQIDLQIEKRPCKHHIAIQSNISSKGFCQVLRKDYTDTYSPVAKFVSIRIFLTISVQLGLVINTIYVDTALYR